MASITSIENQESALSVRDKLNAVISEVNKQSLALSVVQRPEEELPARPDAEVVYWHTWDEPPIDAVNNPYDIWYQIPEIVAASVPAAPSNLTSVAGSTEIQLSWTASASTGMNAPTAQRVYQAQTNDFTSASLVSEIAANTDSYGVTGLAESTTYWFWVTAVNATGQSAPSNSTSGELVNTATYSFYSDFSSTPVDTTPTGWNVNDWNATGQWLAKADANATGGIVLEGIGTNDSGNFRNVLTLNETQALTDTKVLAEAFIPTETSATTLPGVVARSTSGTNGYLLGLRTTDNVIRLAKYVNGTFTELATTPYTGGGTKIAMRLEVVGDQVSGSLWNAENAEPTSMMLTATDSSHASGKAGLFTNAAAVTGRYDRIAIGVDSAEFPA